MSRKKTYKDARAIFSDTFGKYNEDKPLVATDFIHWIVQSDTKLLGYIAH